MQAAVDCALVYPLHTQRRDRAEPWLYASDRRAVPGNVVLRCRPDDLAPSRRWLIGKREAKTSTDTPHGTDADVPEAQREQAGTRAE